MKVYRISLAKFAELKASGREARWHSEGKFVIYTSWSRSLACLENVVHRDSVGLKMLFKVLAIELPDELKIIDVLKEYPIKQLEELSNDSFCRKIGDDWLKQGKSCILKVPSIIISQEDNYIINTQHPDFQKINIISIENFTFDPRLKSS